MGFNQVDAFQALKGAAEAFWKAVVDKVVNLGRS